MGLSTVKQNRHHRCHPLEVTGTTGPAQLPTQPLDPHHGIAAGRIDIRHRGQKQGVAPLPFQKFPITDLFTWIALKILIGAELGRIDEDGDQHPVALMTRLTHQGQMPFMQRSHGRHKTDAAPPAPHPGHPFAQGLGSVKQFHHASLKQCSAAGKRPVRTSSR